MKLTSISSYRNRYKGGAWEIVYEWEDIISKQLSLPVITPNNKLRRVFEKLGICNIYDSIFVNNGYTLYFLSVNVNTPNTFLGRRTIPVIIDFWLKDSELPLFFDMYRNVPLILVTSREVYDKLKQNNCPLIVEHWPLSYPDQYAFTRKENYKKEYDFCIFGRPNPFFIRLLNKYSEEYPNFRYIVNKGQIPNRYYIDNRGDIIAEDKGRESYLDMIKKTKISCYSTPGIDEAKEETNDYNQVTPRVFEMLCNGCYVIGHYPQSSDVVWYHLDEVVPNVNSYEEFKETLNVMLSSDLDIVAVKRFMDNHYTSKRIPLLIEILSKYSISVK